MSTNTTIHRPEFFKLRLFPDGSRIHHCFHINAASWRWSIASMDSNLPQIGKNEGPAIPVRIPPIFPQPESSIPKHLQFDRLQLSDESQIQINKTEFGEFVAREAVLDEEYWTAAWLRAESHWEDQPHERYVNNFKKKYAEQEFNAIRRRCRGENGQQTSTCIVTVKKDQMDTKQTVVKSVVGTLDLSIQYMLQGETFPGEIVENSYFCSSNKRSSSKYGYIANLCVAKSSRRQGIASNMMNFAIELAISNGVDKVYVHVHRSNKAAQDLYQKMGFEIVEIASRQFLQEENYMLSLKTSKL